MLNEKAINGLTKASPEKRYKNFLNTVTDLEEVWLLSSKNGYATVEFDGFIHILLWPQKEFCKCVFSEDEKPCSFEIHEFLEKCKNLDNSIRFMVFPTEVDSYVVTAEQLYSDIAEHLEEIE